MHGRVGNVLVTVVVVGQSFDPVHGAVGKVFFVLEADVVVSWSVEHWSPVQDTVGANLPNPISGLSPISAEFYRQQTNV